MMGKHKTASYLFAWDLALFFLIMGTLFQVIFILSFKTDISLLTLLFDGLTTLLFLGEIFGPMLWRPTFTNFQKVRKGLNKNKKHFWLFVDIASTIPFVALTAITSWPLLALSLVRLLKIVRIYQRLGHLVHLAAIPKLTRPVIALLASGIIIHTTACLWHQIEPVKGDESLLGQYTHALYFIVETLTTVGYGDITPTTTMGRLFTIVLMLSGVLLYGSIIGMVSTLLLQNDRHKEAFQQKIEDLSTFMRHYYVPQRLQNQVFDYLHHLHEKQVSANDSKMITDLPNALKIELEIYMKLRLIGDLSVFRYCEVTCLKEVAQSLQQVFFSPGDVIIRSGMVGEEMFIIGHGHVAIFDRSEDSKIAELKQGEFFGEGALLHEQERSATVKAIEYCDLYKLQKEDFLKIIRKYPSLKYSIEEEIQNRLKAA